MAAYELVYPTAGSFEAWIAWRNDSWCLRLNVLSSHCHLSISLLIIMFLGIADGSTSLLLQVLSSNSGIGLLDSLLVDTFPPIDLDTV